MNPLFTIVLLLTAGACPAQDSIALQTRAILEEGKRLYESEITSWNGTDIFLAAWKEPAKIGGYFSYTDKDYSKCIFYSKGDTPRVIGTILFYTVYDGSKASETNLMERDFTPPENELYLLRRNALAVIKNDTLFKVYPNTDLNLVPLVVNGERKVYVLTAPQKDSVIIFGNDYLLSFDSSHTLTGKRKLHANILYTDYSNAEPGKDMEGGIHTHLPETGNFITPTDICTLMLYERQLGWNSYIVVSAGYTSIWNCRSNTFIAVPCDATKDKDKRHKKGH